MRPRYAEERDKAYRILDLTSLTIAEFEQLVPAFETAFLASMDEWTLEGKPRTGRRYRQYATCPLPSPEDRLLFILSYLNVAPIQAAHGVLFGMGQPKANQWIHTLLPVLGQALAVSGALPARSRADLEERLAHVTVDASPPFFVHDGTERSIVRSQDTDEQRSWYSDKKKRHTVKNVLLVHTFLVVFLSDTYEGSAHDTSIADATPYPLPLDSELLDDLGFLGYELAKVQHTRPIRKPKGGELAADQKEHNRQVARWRVVIENILSSIKRCRILKDTFRLWKEDVRDLVMEICCGLHNFRLRLNPWPTRTL